MSFTAFTVAPKGPAGTGLSANLVKMRQGRARLCLFLRMAVAARFGWSDGDRLEVALGEDEHHGLIRLRRADGGTAIVRRRETRLASAPYIRIELGPIDLFVDRSEARRWCGFEVLEDGWVEVVLPSWADETGPRKRERTAALPSLRSLALPPPASHSVTASLAGDPPPGRSALAQRGPARPRTRGEARRQAEAREATQMAEEEAGDWNRRAADDDRLGQLMGVFGLTRTEARYLHCLLDGRLKTKETLLALCHDASEEVEIKLVDVYVHKLRKKLKTRLIEIETMWGQGYRMAPDHAARVMVLLDAADGPTRDEDEAELAAMGNEDGEEAA